MKDKEASVSEISRQTPGELMKCLSQFLLLGALILLSVKGVRAQTPEDPLVKELENRPNASDVEEGNRRAGMKSFSADDLKPMRLKFAAIANVLILFWLFSLGSALSQTPAPAALPTSSSLSPDKQWEYKCAEYGLGQCAPEIVKAGTTQVVLDLADLPSGSDAKQAEVVWAPDSKRLAFNYSPPHAHHTTFESVAFYQLRGDKWVALHSPADDIKEGSQLAQPLKKHLPKGFNPRRCAPNRDVLKLRNWTDANNAILYAPCYGRVSGQLEAAFLFTLKFDEAGNWKIIKTHQMSKKELEDE